MTSRCCSWASRTVRSLPFVISAMDTAAFPKERVELFADGAVVRIDNWRRMRGWGVGGLRTRLPHAQDKGHAALAAAFVRAVRGEGPPPIAADDILEVSLWAIRAGELATHGGGVA